MIFEIYMMFVFLSALSGYYIFRVGKNPYSQAKLLVVIVVSIIPIINIVPVLTALRLMVVFTFFDRDGHRKQEFISGLKRAKPKQVI